MLRLVANIGVPDTDPKQSIIDDKNIKSHVECNSLHKTNRKGKIEITKHVGRHCHADTSKEREVTMHDNDLNLDYPNYCAKLIDAVKKGYESYDDLEKASGQNRKLLSVYFDGFHKFLLTNKLIQMSDKSKRQAVIDFIQSRLCDTNYKQNEQPAQIHEQNTTIHEQNTTIHEQNTPPNEQPQVSVTKSAMISRIADLSKQCTALMSENDKLRERIKELENQPKQTVDFTEAKQKLHAQIEQLQTQLNAIEIAERMIQNNSI